MRGRGAQLVKPSDERAKGRRRPDRQPERGRRWPVRISAPCAAVSSARCRAGARPGACCRGCGAAPGRCAAAPRPRASRARPAPRAPAPRAAGASRARERRGRAAAHRSPGSPMAAAAAGASGAATAWCPPERSTPSSASRRSASRSSTSRCIGVMSSSYSRNRRAKQPEPAVIDLASPARSEPASRRRRSRAGLRSSSWRSSTGSPPAADSPRSRSANRHGQLADGAVLGGRPAAHRRHRARRRGAGHRRGRPVHGRRQLKVSSIRLLPPARWTGDAASLRRGRRAVLGHPRPLAERDPRARGSAARSTCSYADADFRARFEAVPRQHAGSPRRARRSAPAYLRGRRHRPSHRQGLPRRCRSGARRRAAPRHRQARGLSLGRRVRDDRARLAARSRDARHADARSARRGGGPGALHRA